MKSRELCLCFLAVWINTGQSSNCGHQQAALYRVVFHAEWTEARFPKHYPRWRPNAQWSPLVGRSHNSLYSLWKMGSPSSDAVKLYAETGKTDLLVTEAQGAHGLFDEFYGPPILEGTGISESQFLVDSNHSKVSLMCRIVPSPDWFVGIDSLELCSEGKSSWIKSATFDLEPEDAGTDNGFTFTAPNWDTEPRAKISRITSHHPSHPANSFYYPQQKKLPPIGKFKLVLIKVFEQKMDLDLGLTTEEETELRIIGKGETSSLVPRLRHQHTIVNGQRHQQTVETEVDFVKQEDNRDLKRLMQDAIEARKVDEETNLIDSKKTDVRKKFKRKHKKRPRSCRVSEWSEWSPCSKTCGFGESFRTKVVLKHGQPGGLPCPSLRETKWCGSTRNCRSPSGYFVW